MMVTRLKKRRLTPEEARAFKERWRFVNEMDRLELERLTVDDRIRQLAVLMTSVDSFGWAEKLQAESDASWKNWQRLRQRYRA
jgi:hypothetical protein